MPLAGPASGSPSWTAELSRYLAANPRVRIVTFHRYPLHRCFTERGASTYPTIPNLLAPRSSTGPGLSLQAAVRVAHTHGLPVRADELNSVSCGGARGVSDTFASALWVLDTLFNMAAVGVDGVNIHTFNKALYEPFSFTHSSGGWQAHVDPTYYGMLMFARAAPTGSRLLSTNAASSRALRIWAIRAPDGTVRVAVINDSPTRTLVLAVRPPRTSSAATLERLTAPTSSPGQASRSPVRPSVPRPRPASSRVATRPRRFSQSSTATSSSSRLQAPRSSRLEPYERGRRLSTALAPVWLPAPAVPLAGAGAPSPTPPTDAPEKRESNRLRASQTS